MDECSPSRHRSLRGLGPRPPRVATGTTARRARRLVLAASVGGALLGGSGQARAEDPWWDVFWLERTKLTFDNSEQATNLVDFPVLVRLDSTRIDFSKTEDLGEDIRFTDSDGTTPLAYEIEQWDESGDCYVWVKVPQIDASSNTDYIWMYYSNAGASDGQDPANVWDASFQLVWHCQESAGTTIGDSTGNGNDGAKRSVAEPAAVAAGRVAGAQTYDGNNDYVWVENLAPVAVPITMEAWIRPVAHSGSWATIMQFSGDKPFFGLCCPNGDGEPLLHYDRGGKSIDGVAGLSFGQWVYIVATHAGGTANIYLNGALDSSGDVANSKNGMDFFVGLWDTGSDSPFDGSIDEVRVSSVMRSADWIAAQHLSMTDAFIIQARPKIVLWQEVAPE